MKTFSFVLIVCMVMGKCLEKASKRYGFKFTTFVEAPFQF